MKKTIFIFQLLLIFSQIFATDGTPQISLSTGLTLDVAPFGIEKKYISLQGQILSDDLFSIGFKPALSLNRESVLLRLPLVAGYNLKWVFPYGGCGIEFASYSGNATNYPFLTCGIQLFIKPIFIDIPIVMLLKSNDTDVDISFLAGVSL